MKFRNENLFNDSLRFMIPTGWFDDLPFKVENCFGITKKTTRREWCKCFENEEKSSGYVWALQFVDP